MKLEILPRWGAAVLRPYNGGMRSGNAMRLRVAAREAGRMPALPVIAKMHLAD